MSTENSKSSRKADHWQRKYYDSLGELEDKEKEWAALESILRQLVTRLILITNPDDDQLEKRLERLRNSLRDGRDLLRLSPQIEEVSQAILQLDKKSKKSIPTDNPAEVLDSLLDQLSIPKSLKRQEKHVRKRIQKSNGKDIDELLKILAELLGLSLDTQIEEAKKQFQPEQEKKPGFLKNLFGDKGEQAQEEDKKEIKKEHTSATEKDKTSDDVQAGLAETKVDDVEILPEFEEVDEEAERQAKTKTEQADSKQTADEAEAVEYLEALSVSDIAYAGEILIQLLEKMELPNDLCVEAGLIRQRLEPCEEHKVLQQGLESTIALVADAHSRALDEKKEMELFLKQLTERLHEMDVDLQETARLHARSASDTRDVNNAVKDEVKNMEDSVEHAKDLGSLQTAIQSRIIIIRDHMDRFLEAEQSRDTQYKSLNEKLRGQLGEAEEEIELLRTQLENARKQAMVDALTGLANRKAYDERIEDEMARFKRYGSVFSVMALDIDHFKKINDTYGHVAGDKVLKVIGSKVMENTRETDFPARYGGEEFVVLLAETNQSDALVLANKMRKLIEDCGFHFRKKRVVITTSIGIAESRKGDSATSLFARADEALYKAKTGGRNRCEVA